MEKKDLRLHRDQYLGKNMHVRVEQRSASSFPLHTHEYFEIESVMKGKGRQWLNGRFIKGWSPPCCAAWTPFADCWSRSKCRRSVCAP